MKKEDMFNLAHTSVPIPFSLIAPSSHHSPPSHPQVLTQQITHASVTSWIALMFSDLLFPSEILPLGMALYHFFM